MDGALTNAFAHAVAGLRDFVVLSGPRKLKTAADRTAGFLWYSGRAPKTSTEQELTRPPPDAVA